MLSENDNKKYTDKGLDYKKYKQEETLNNVFTEN